MVCQINKCFITLKCKWLCYICIFKFKKKDGFVLYYFLRLYFIFYYSQSMLLFHQIYVFMEKYKDRKEVERIGSMVCQINKCFITLKCKWLCCICTFKLKKKMICFVLLLTSLFYILLFSLHALLSSKLCFYGEIQR
jgi:hypothetical protein